MDTAQAVDIDFLRQIAEQANSDLLLFFIVLAAVAIPVIIVLQRGRAAQSKQNAEREKNLIDVIRSNTEAMSGVTAAVEVLAVTLQNDEV